LKQQHLCVSVREVLFKTDIELVDEYRDRIIKDDGTALRNAVEIRNFFMDELSLGHEVIPFDGPCDGFDYVHGCPGHEIVKDKEAK
jgi:hypothetical protein